MSTNVSLANAGTSLNFDGQALQNQQEAEIEREEQQQQHELRQLLSNAFDDLDDDILSVASSEGDSVNISHTSVHQESFRGPLSPVSVQHDGAVSEKSVSGTGSLASRSVSAVGSPAVASLTQPVVRNKPLFQDTSVQSSSSKSSTGNERFLRSSQEDLFRFAPQQTWSNVGGHFHGQREVGNPNDCHGQLLAHDDGKLDRDGQYYHFLQHGQSEFTSGNENQHSGDLNQNAQHMPPYPGDHQRYLNSNEEPQFGQYWGNGADVLPAENSHNGLLYGNTGEGGFPSHTSANALHENYAGVGHGYHNYPQHVSSEQHFLRHQFQSHPYGTHQGETLQQQNAPENSAQHVVDWEDEVGPRSFVPTAYSSGRGWPQHDEPAERDVWHQGNATNPDKHPKEVGFRPPSDAPESDRVASTGDDFHTDYKVQYKKSQVSHSQPASTPEHDVQQEFVQQEDINSDTRQLSQLQVLYRTRGRQLEDVNAELEKLQLESAKERRMLKHLLSVATGEKEGVGQSLKESQKLLQEAKETQNQVSNKLQATEAQFQAMKEAKEELGKKLQSAETTIENLTHQLAELRQSDSLAQARNQHEAVISSMQQRFDKEILTLKEKLDEANENIAEKSTEIASLRRQVLQQTQIAEQAQISRGETINQLTRSLEESQRRCQTLLEAASTDEVSVLKAQLQQALVSKSMSDNMCTSLQSEMRELKEQLSMLEAASSLGALSNSNTQQGSVYTDDSMADLGIRKTLDFSTPDSATKFDGSQSSEQLISSLRRELERCLASNKQKRTLVTELQEQKRHLQQQVTELQEELASTRKMVDSQQVKLKSFEDRFGDGLQESAVEARLKKDIENLQREKMALTQDIDDYKMRLNEVSSSAEQLTELNRKLNQQMAEMVREHDEDKREAIDRCRRTCEDSHKTARENLERSLRSEFFADKQELIMKYEKQLTDSREETQQLQEELDRVKEMYVESSKELVQHDDKLQATYNNNLREELKKLRQTLEQEKEEAVKMETQRLETEMSQLREEIESQLKEQMKQQTEAQEAQLKKQWESQQKEAVDQAVKTTQQEWQEKLQQQIKELEQRFATEKAQWEHEKQTTIEKQIEQRLEKERRSWQVQTDREALDQVDMAVDAAKRQWADETRQELQAVKAELDRCSATHQAELADMEEKWQQELSDKQAALERELKTRFQDTLQQEVQQRLADQRKELQLEADARLTKQLAELEAAKTEELKRRLTDEKERLETELNKRLETEKKAAVDEARSQWETDLSEEQKKLADSGTQEISKWRAEVTRLKGELKTQTSRWEEARSKLVQEKEEERRQAVSSVRAQCEQDYHSFMEENKATLDSALAAARQEHQREMEEQAARHREEMAALREVEQELRRALADKMSDDKSPSSDLTPDTDQKLSRKVEKLKKEISQRDELLRQADTHMEQEVKRLRESLEENYARQREKDNLRAQSQYSQAMHISQKERTRLEKQLETVLEELRQQKERHAEQVESLEAQLAEYAENSGRLAEQEDVERVVTQMQQVQEERDQLLSELEDTRAVMEQLSQERDALQSQVEEREAGFQEERSRLSGRLSECQAAIRALDADRTSLSSKLDSVKQQHTEELGEVQRKLDQTKTRLRQVEAALSAVNKQHREDVQKVTETMTNDHQHELQELHTQLAQMRKQQEMMIEEVERKHQAEKQEMFEQLRRQAQRALAHTPTQTDTDDSLSSLKDQYFHTVHKIKGEVMSHISQTNERAALTLKTEVRMERQRTIQHLRRRCRSRLRHLLQSQSEGCRGEQVWQLVDSALESLFDSVSSSLSATPSTSAGVTPRSSEDDSAVSDVAVDTAREEGDIKQPVRRQPANHVNISSSSGGAYSTPQSVGSDRYQLPSALGKVELFDQGQSDTSLSELQGSGVFFPLVPDDTASVTDVASDTEQDFKHPRPVHRKNKQLSKLEDLSHKLSKFPVKGGKFSTLPASRSTTKAFQVSSKEPAKSKSAALFSPKMHHSKGRQQGEVGVSGESVGWKDVDAGVWTEAVGSTNLWQAYSDLKDMELGDKQPRRQLRFQSQSFLDGFTDSDTDSRHGEADQEVKRLVTNQTLKQAGKLQAASASIRRSALVSKSGDFSRKTKSLSVRYKSMDDLIPESSMEDVSAPGTLKQSHTTPDLREGDHDSSYAPHQEKDKSGTVPSKLLLNPKKFLSKPVQKLGRSGDREGETLDSMMARLGFTKSAESLATRGQTGEDSDAVRPAQRHSDSFVLDNRKTAVSSKGRKSDSFLQENLHVPREAGESAEYVVPKRKSRTHSADDVSWSHHHHQGRHSSDRSSNRHFDLHKLLRPESSGEPRAARHGHVQHGHRHRSDLDLVQRSLEETQVKARFPQRLSHNERTKSQSEQALHMLHEAVGPRSGRDSGDSVYHYTPLQHLLPPPSPSTSLLSTYSVSEGDLRLAPYGVVSKESEHF